MKEHAVYVRDGVELTSEEKGRLEYGEIFNVTERQFNTDDIPRIRIASSGFWTSEIINPKSGFSGDAAKVYSF
jgi:hypothetical protein